MKLVSFPGGWTWYCHDCNEHGDRTTATFALSEAQAHALDVHPHDDADIRLLPG